MPKSDTPSAPKTAGDDRNLVAVDENYAALTFEDRLRIYWQKHGKSIVALIVVVLLGVLAKGAWDYRAAQKELEVQREFAGATTPVQLKAFAAAHKDHVLAGVARLQLADADYAAGRSTEAIYGYEDALPALKTGPLASRARLGLAMAKIQGGKSAEGEAALREIAIDPTEAKGTRSEAAYQLASLASVAGKGDDVRKYSAQLMQIDPTSPWLQRLLMLQATNLAPNSTPAPAAVTPAVKLPGMGK